MMKRLLPLLGLLLFAVPASATISFPQITENISPLADGNSITISATGSNNALVTCAVYYGGTFTSSTVPTDGGDTFILINSSTNPPRESQCWYALTVTTGRTAVTYHCSCVNFDATIWEVHSSTGAAFILDTNGGSTGVVNNQTAAATELGASVTTNGSNDVIFATAASTGTADMNGTIANGGVTFSCDKCTLNNNSVFGFVSLLNKASGTYQAAFTYSPTGVFGNVTLSLTEGVGASGGGGFGGTGGMGGKAGFGYWRRVKHK